MSLERHAFQTCICSLIVFNSFFVLYVMCCFGNNPLYMDFTPMKILFCSVLFISIWIVYQTNKTTIKPMTLLMVTTFYNILPKKWIIILKLNGVSLYRLLNKENRKSTQTLYGWSNQIRWCLNQVWWSKTKQMNIFYC